MKRTPNKINTFHCKMISVLLLLLLPSFVIANVVGNVSFSRGVVAAIQAEQNTRLLAKGSEIYEGDTIQTSEQSFTILAFADGAKITIRPESTFVINRYINEPGNRKADLQLIKGGVRTSTGSIAQQKPENFTIHTEAKTIHAQQADYTVRVCTDDCIKEDEQATDANTAYTPVNSVVARVVKLKGVVTAQDQSSQDEPRRNLSVGGPIYRQDKVSSASNSYTLLAFRDAGRITVQPESEFHVSAYNHDKTTGSGKAVFKLVKGGLRALTGSIGKIDKENYQINTPVATIGIRGTGFDLLCKGENCRYDESKKTCAIDKNRQQKICTDKADSKEKGLHSYVWNSVITQQNNSGDYSLSEDHANYIATEDSVPIPYEKVPGMFLKNSSPRPDQDDSDTTALFGSDNIDGTPPGVYLFVHDGHVQMDEFEATNTELSDSGSSPPDSSLSSSPNTGTNITGGNLQTGRSTKPSIGASASKQSQSMHLGKNEAAYIDQNSNMIRLDQPLDFQMADPYLVLNDLENINMELGAFSLLNDNIAAPQNTVFQCNAF